MGGGGSWSGVGWMDGCLRISIYFFCGVLGVVCICDFLEQFSSLVLVVVAY